MSRQLNHLLREQSWLSALFVCIAVTAACGGTSDTEEASASGGSAASLATAGKPTVASAGSVAAGGQLVGSGGSGNSAGIGGSFQFAGASNQPGGTGGAPVTGGTGGGSSGGSGGARWGSGGARSGSGGSATGSGGAKSGSGGSAGHAGQSSGGSSGGMTPTWTEIYTKFLSNAQYASNCNGAACHNPGKQKGFDFSTQANGYASVKSKTSQLVSELSSGAMPQGKTKMPAADLAIIKAWVAAGAQNN